MSLKHFHIFFIVVSTLTTLGFGLVTLADYFRGKSTENLWLGALSLAAAVGLIWYGIRFFKKLRQL